MIPRCEEEITKATNTNNRVTFYNVYYGMLYLVTLVSIGGNSLVISCWFRHNNLHASANAQSCLPARRGASRGGRPFSTLVLKEVTEVLKAPVLGFSSIFGISNK